MLLVMDLQGRVVIVTGASAGIGRAVAQRLTSEGARVVLAARDADALRTLEEQLPDSMAVPTDVTRAGDAAHLVTRAIARFGRIDVLVNNAARAMAKPVEQIDIDEFRDTFELNVIAPLRLIQLVVPHMRANGGGAIINVSSQAAAKHIPFIAGYASTKAALSTLSLTVRDELRGDSIAVGLIRPGIVDTDFGAHTPSPEPDSLRHAADGTLLAHVIDPGTVADGICSLIRSGEAILDIVAP